MFADLEPACRARRRPHPQADRPRPAEEQRIALSPGRSAGRAHPRRPASLIDERLAERRAAGPVSASSPRSTVDVTPSRVGVPERLPGWWESRAPDREGQSLSTSLSYQAVIPARSKYRRTVCRFVSGSPRRCWKSARSCSSREGSLRAPGSCRICGFEMSQGRRLRRRLNFSVSTMAADRERLLWPGGLP